MLDHIGLSVSDLSAARQFYLQALAPLGIAAVMEVTEEMTGGHGAHLGLGTPGKPFFWIGSGTAASGGVHVAFVANNAAQVDAFHAAALAAGGTDNGAPGLRPHYHPGYYAPSCWTPGGTISKRCSTVPADHKQAERKKPPRGAAFADRVAPAQT